MFSITHRSLTLRYFRELPGQISALVMIIEHDSDGSNVSQKPVIAHFGKQNVLFFAVVHAVGKCPNEVHPLSSLLPGAVGHTVHHCLAFGLNAVHRRLDDSMFANEDVQ